MPDAHRARTAWAQPLDATTWRPGGALRAHDFAVVAILTEGSAVARQGADFALQAGDAYLVPAGAMHGLVSVQAARAWGVAFQPSCVAGDQADTILGLFEQAADGASPLIPIRSARQSHLAGLCEELHRESSATDPLAEVARRSLLSLVLAELARSSEVQPQADRRPGVVRDALRFIERNCLAPLSLRDVAAHVERSPSHVSTTIRQATGRSVTEWIVAGRLAEARRRLVHTSERVDEVADQIGYADPTHFIRMFRRVHGCTPAAWRAKERAERALHVADSP